MAWFFGFFVVSGFCSLVYQVVWLRLAMADFGVNTPLVSLVLSVFMAGLALGSWGAGRIAHRLSGRSAGVFLRLYAAMESLIGISGLVVVPILGFGRSLLAGSGGAAWGSTSYYLASGTWIALTLLPFGACMGATFPLAMAGIRGAFPAESPRSFSYLYVANVLGAMAGTLGSAFVLIEILGFQGTLGVAAMFNGLIAVLAMAVSRGPSWKEVPAEQPLGRPQNISHLDPGTSRVFLALLFATGLISIAMEVVWVRQFVPFQGPVVYAFATVLAVYLAATVAGSRLYRIWAKRRGTAPGSLPWGILASVAGACSLVPMLTADPRIPMYPGLLRGGLRAAFGLAPFCGVLGFLTPMLVDRYAAGDPGRAGRAYAINTVGCIIGPLVAGFWLLPAVGERWTLVLLALPFFGFGFHALRFPARSLAPGDQRSAARSRRSLGLSLGLSLVASALLALLTRDFETIFPQRVVRRDYTATVIATGTGMEKQLLVNGMGITSLTPITKMMVDLPMALVEQPPARGLVLCFGMGTSFRSMLAWGVPTTVVELVPSVPGLFGYYHEGQEGLLHSPLATIVIDDARRFLERSRETFSVIVIDPPPPVEAAASSLLYSREFYASARKRLAPGGILQQWLPTGEPIVVTAVTRALTESFRYVRVYKSIEGWGIHFLASERPIPTLSAAEMAARLPAAVSEDLLEWGPMHTVQDQLQPVIGNEVPVQGLLDAYPGAPTLSDNRPVNEYYFLRRHRG